MNGITAVALLCSCFAALPSANGQSPICRIGLPGLEFSQEELQVISENDHRSFLPPNFLSYHKSTPSPGLKRVSAGPYALPEPKTVLLIIDNRIQTHIASHLDQYISDLETDNWTVIAQIYQSGNIWDIRQEIIAVHQNPSLPPLDGVVLIGRIPAPRYRSEGPGNPYWNGYCAYETPNIYMFFYGNLREDHGYHPNSGCTNWVYHLKPPGVDNWSPEIWVSVIRGNWLPILGGGLENNEDIEIEAAKIINYFGKNHRVRTGQVPIYKKGLAVSAFGPEQAANFQAHLLNLTGGVVDQYYNETLPSAAWNKYYDWASLASHGSPDWFLGKNTQDFYINICNIKFINICACRCGNLDMGQNDLRDCIAQGMVMEPDGDIVTTFSGADLNGGMGNLDEYTSSIAQGNTIGKAYADWERDRWAGWNSHSGDGSIGDRWPIERFASIIFGDGTIYYPLGGPPVSTPLPTPTTPPTPPPMPPAVEPISYWNFDEGVGNEAADSTGTNNGIIHGSAWVDGVRGRALEFDGESSYVEIQPPLAQIPYNISISAWIKLYSESSTSGWGVVSSGYNSSIPFWMVEIDPQNQIRIYTPTKYSTASLPLPAQQWQHIAWTTDTQAGRIYVNGDLIETFEPVVSNPAVSGIQGAIGRGYGSRVSFHGIIDEVKIYNSFLSGSEILYLYLHDKPVPVPTPSSTTSPTPSVAPKPSATPTSYATPAPSASAFPPPTRSPAPSITPVLSITPLPPGTPISTATPPPSFPPPWRYDFNGDGSSDIAIFRPGSGLWAIRGVTRTYFGAPDDVPVPGDYTGNMVAEISVFRPASGLWAIRGLTRIYFGQPSDLCISGDYSGDGTWSPAVFRPVTGLWAIRGLTRVYFGSSADVPIPWYYYSGKTIRLPAVFRPTAGIWAIRNLTRFYFGRSNDLPVPGDYDGTGFWTPAVFRPLSGLWAVRSLTRLYFGGFPDIPLPAGYTGQEADGIGIFRISSGLWAVRGITRIYFGSQGDIPIVR